CFSPSHLADLKQNIDTRRSRIATGFMGRNLQGEALSLEITFGAFCNQGQNVFTAFVRHTTKQQTKRWAALETGAVANDQSLILVAEDDENDLLLLLRAFEQNCLANPVQVVRDGEE